MAAALAVLFLLIPIPTDATTIVLPSEIVEFVPSCATSCLSTFIDANFPANVCGTEPTFQCLCAHTGSNGFTVGEGALECIASVDRTGQCTGTDAAATASSKAYSMCYGQTSAAPETHATIVVTLVVPLQSQSTRTVTTTVAGPAERGSGTEQKTTAAATAQSTLSTSRTSTSTWTTADFTESQLLTAPPHSTTPTTATTTSTSHPTAKTTASSAQNSATSDQTQPTSNAATLSKAQIVGISVGTAAVLFAAIGLSLYLRRVRHRRLRTVPKLTGDDRGSADDENGFRKRFRPRTGHELQISVPVNLQAPRKPNTLPAVPWHEKNNNYPPRPLQNQYARAPAAPPKNSPVVPIPKPAVTQPTTNYSPYRPQQQQQPQSQRQPQPQPQTQTQIPQSESNRSLTSRPTNGQYEPSRTRPLAPPTARPGLQISTSVTDTQNVGPSPINRPPVSQATGSRTSKSPISARTTAYPSYYDTNPDDDLPNFGYQQPARPTQKPQHLQLAQPVRPVQPAQTIQQPQSKLPSVSHPPSNARDSVVTEFAEDGEDLSPRGDHTYPLFPQIRAEAQARPPQSQSRPKLQPLPQFQVQQHEPQLRPQPRTPPMREPVDSGIRPFMSPSLVPRPLELPRNPGPRNPGNPTLLMPKQAGSNVSRMAKMRLGDQRAINLRLDDSQQPQRPRQNAGWHRMDGDAGPY